MVELHFERDVSENSPLQPTKNSAGVDEAKVRYHLWTPGFSDRQGDAHVKSLGVIMAEPSWCRVSCVSKFSNGHALLDST